LHRPALPVFGAGRAAGAGKLPVGTDADVGGLAQACSGMALTAFDLVGRSLAGDPEDRMVGGDARTGLQGGRGAEADVRARARRDAKVGLDDRRPIGDRNQPHRMAPEPDNRGVGIGSRIADPGAFTQHGDEVGLTGHLRDARRTGLPLLRPVSSNSTIRKDGRPSADQAAQKRENILPSLVALPPR